LRANQGDAAARDDAFFHCGTGCIESVLDARLLLFHLELARSAHLDDGDAAYELHEALLKLVLVEFVVFARELRAKLPDASGELLFAAGAADDRRLVLVERDAASAAEIGKVKFSSLSPSSSLIGRAPVSTAMSLSASLRRSPKLLTRLRFRRTARGLFAVARRSGGHLDRLSCDRSTRVRLTVPAACAIRQVQMLLSGSARKRTSFD
jgi:hypothetical protein